MSENPLQCLVCLNTIQEQASCLFFYPHQCHCKVILHRQCASQWLQQQSKCLICKQLLQVNDFIEIQYSSEKDYCSIITRTQRQAITTECRRSCIGIIVVISILIIIAFLSLFILLFIIHQKKQ